LPNILILLGDDPLRGLFERRIEQYLQPDFIRWSFAVATGEELTRVTGQPERFWRFLLTDADTLALNQDSVATFRESNPETLVAVLGTESDQSALAATGFTVLRPPSTEDRWLRMMRQLLHAAGRQAT